MRPSGHPCGACGKQAPDCAYGYDAHCPHKDEVFGRGIKRGFAVYLILLALMVFTFLILLVIVGPVQWLQMSEYRALEEVLQQTPEH